MITMEFVVQGTNMFTCRNRDALTQMGITEENANLLLLPGTGSMVKVAPWQRPRSAPTPPQGAPGGSGQLSTPRVRPGQWDPSHRLRCSS